MSKESFLKEFYPIPASEATNSWLEATNHSIQKWKGMLAENLEKHNQIMSDEWHIVISDNGENTLAYGNSTCALCSKAINKADSYFCNICPLMMLFSCECGDEESAYMSTKHTRNPQPMIDALYATQRFLLASAMPPSPRSIFSSPIMDFTEQSIFGEVSQ